MATHRPPKKRLNHGLGEDDDGLTPDTETTPLLAASSSPVAPISDAKVAQAVISSASSPSSSPPSTTTSPTPPSKPKPFPSRPFPKTQLLLLCYARLLEPIAFFSIFPYINEMVLLNGHGAIPESAMGFYSGLIESLFSLTQMLVMVLWGRLADRYGRKPVLVFSLVGVSLSTGLFGFARSIPQMILFRCAAGFFGGSIVTVRTMISEISGREHQAVAFSWFAVGGNLGIFVGPLLGGALADPARLYPRLFGGVWFFETFPYALSSLLIGVLGLSAVVVSALGIEETLPSLKKKAQRAGDNINTNTNANANTEEEEAETEADPESTPRPLLSTRALLSSPGVAIVLYNYGHVALLAFAYTAVVPVFWASRVSLGGLGFSPLQISLFMGLTGLSQAVWLLAVFPPLHRRIGTNGIMRVCGAAYPFFLGGMPFLNLVLRPGTKGGVVAFWILAPLMLTLGPGVSMSFTGVQLALNDVAPSHETLGMLNALALTLSSGLRSFSPALFASLFAVGAGSQIFGGYLVWVVLVGLAGVFTVSTRFLPEERGADGDEEEEDGGQV